MHYVIIARSAFASTDRNEREQWVVWSGPRKEFHSLNGHLLTKEEAEIWLRYFAPERDAVAVPADKADELLLLLRK